MRLAALLCSAAVIVGLPLVVSAPAFADAERAEVSAEIIVTGERRGVSTLGLDENAETASRLGIAVRDLPASVSVIDAETIRARGDVTALDAVTR